MWFLPSKDRVTTFLVLLNKEPNICIFKSWCEKVNILLRIMKLTSIKTKNCDNHSKIYRREVVDGVGYLKKSTKKKRISGLTYYSTYIPNIQKD